MRARGNPFLFRAFLALVPNRQGMSNWRGIVYLSRPPLPIPVDIRHTARGWLALPLLFVSKGIPDPFTLTTIGLGLDHPIPDASLPSSAWHARTVDEVLASVGLPSLSGLTEAEAERRLSAEGENLRREAKPVRPWKLFLVEFLKTAPLPWRDSHGAARDPESGKRGAAAGIPYSLNLK